MFWKNIEDFTNIKEVAKFIRKGEAFGDIIATLSTATDEDGNTVWIIDHNENTGLVDMNFTQEQAMNELRYTKFKEI